MSAQESLDSASDLAEDLVLLLPTHRWGVFWFGLRRPLPVRLHFDPGYLRFWFTDIHGGILLTYHCETLGGRAVVEAKERLVQLHSTRMGTTERVHRRQAIGLKSDPQTPPPTPPVLSAPANHTTPPELIEVAPFSDSPADPPESQPPPTQRTTSLFKPRKTKVVDVIARVKKTERVKRASTPDEEPDPFKAG